MNKKIILTASAIIVTTIFLVSIFFTDEKMPMNDYKSSESNSVTSSNEEVIEMSASFPSFEIDQLVEESELIVLGNIESILNEYNEDGNVPFSDYALNVETILIDNSNVTSNTITVKQDGNSSVFFENHPLLEIDKSYILFLKKSSISDKYIIVGGPSGKFELDNNKIAQANNSIGMNGKTIDEFVKIINQ
ncbi:hypothetical protein ACTWP4_18580 [Gracilibacillus sp. D59]|uniref:hypothetical protein n=1 Tax=Gracilibacillus sp. D59 TaxID=3457434 RepID=UPI003FCDD036